MASISVYAMRFGTEKRAYYAVGKVALHGVADMRLMASAIHFKL
jgi:hypothetical protein